MLDANTDFLSAFHSENKFFILILGSLLPGETGKIKF